MLVVKMPQVVRQLAWLLLLVACNFLIISQYSAQAQLRRGRTDNRRARYDVEVNITAQHDHQPRGNMRLLRGNQGFKSGGRISQASRRPRVHPSKTLAVRVAARIERFLLRVSCRSSTLSSSTSTGRCEVVRSTPAEEMRFYFAYSRANNLLSVALPEGRLKDANSHYAVAVMDPFPGANFGHLVLVFYIDRRSGRRCKRRSLELDGEMCLTLAKRGKCRSLYRSRFNANDLSQKCEVNFLPLVYDERQRNSEKAQLLECQEIRGFSTCPKKLDTSSDGNENCLFTKKSNHCQNKQSVTRRRRPSLCRLFATCDHAVLLFGSWNNIAHSWLQDENMRSFYGMLRENGFRKNNIQIFSKEDPENVLIDDAYSHGLPSNDKTSIRNHIFTLCSALLCVDSLVIYLNGPSTTEGAVLLADLNRDGFVDPNESYSVDQLLDDITNCDANHVFIFADVSYSGILAARLRKKTQDLEESEAAISAWNRVVLLSSGGVLEYSWGHDVTSHWSELTPQQRVSWGLWGYETTQRSQPHLFQRGHHGEDYTIYGAPIVDGMPQLSDNLMERERQYMGCQDLPGSQWDFMKTTNNNEK